MAGQSKTTEAVSASPARRECLGQLGRVAGSALTGVSALTSFTALGFTALTPSTAIGQSTGSEKRSAAAGPPVNRLNLAAMASPQARRIEYDGYLITGFGSTRLASAVMHFQPAGGRYRISLEVQSMLADLSYESTGSIDAFGLVPSDYVEKRKVAFKSRRVKRVRYVFTEDPAAINRRDGDTLFVPPGAQDRLSLMLQVSLMARAYPALLDSGKQLAIPFARIKSVVPSHWSVARPARVRLDGGDEESQAVAAKTMQAQRVARVADAKDSVDVAFWLTADAKRLPLILQFSENGRSLKFVAQV